jgi:hypothetical protein
VLDGEGKKERKKEFGRSTVRRKRKGNKDEY